MRSGPLGVGRLFVDLGDVLIASDLACGFGWQSTAKSITDVTGVLFHSFFGRPGDAASLRELSSSGSAG